MDSHGTANYGCPQAVKKAVRRQTCLHVRVVCGEFVREPIAIVLYLVLLLLILVPLAELVLLIKLAGVVGIFATIGIVICTGLAGVLTARVQGWLVWQKIQLDLRHGVLPADGLIEAIVLLGAGLLLLTPGLLTDAAGALLLIPAARRAVRAWIRRKFREMIERGQTEIVFFREGPTIMARTIDDDHRPDDKRS
jgi:UPF0716 protein FxsA